MTQSRQPAQQGSPTPTTAPPERSRGAGRGNDFARTQLNGAHGHDDQHGAHGHDDHDAARPGPGASSGAVDSTRRPGTDVDAATRQALFARLQGVPEAAVLLEEIKKSSGSLDFPLRWSGRGSYMTAGAIYLDIRARELEAVVQLTHELSHLRNFLIDAWPEATQMGREEYVQTMMKDEIEAEASGTVAGLQATRGAGEVRSNEFRTHMERKRPGAINEAVKTGKGWDLVEAEARVFAEEKFKTTYKASTTGQNYYQYWGEWWDRMNKGRQVSDASTGQESSMAAVREDGRFPATQGSGNPGGATGRGGAETTKILAEDQLKPLNAKMTGPDMLINDNPETFRKSGTLGSTMAPIPERGDTSHTFVGSGRFFALAQNGTGKAQRNQLLIRNTFSKDLTFTIKGTVFVNKGITPTDGRIDQRYKKDGGFQGPQAVAATSFLDAKPGKNGYLEKRVTIKAGDTEIVNNQYHEMGSEVFSLLEITTNDTKGTFTLAHVSSDKTLDEKGIADVTTGRYAAAGDPKSGKDYASAEGSKMGRPNGVITSGSVVTGGRVVSVSKGGREGDLVMSTDTRNSGGDQREIAKISKTLPNPAGLGPAATQNDGNYGLEYRLSYTLKNGSSQKVNTKILLTSPKQAVKDALNPGGGAMTMPVEMNGKRIEVRINSRGTGVLLGTIPVEAGKEKEVNLRWVHMGNTFPPAGVEFQSD